MSDDELLFADEEAPTTSNNNDVWKILIVDDEPSIHDITKLALDNLEVEGRKLSFISAYNGKEAKEAMLANPDTAVVLLDVVMESDHAGLEVAEFIRNEAGNHFSRIVLRTGQPGQAPERQVIMDYDINDYKEKTELTSAKLFTLIYSSIRSYRDIIALENNKHGLERVIEATSNIYRQKNLRKLMKGVLEQLTSLLFIGKDATLVELDGVAGRIDQKEKFKIIAGIGKYEDVPEGTDGNILPEEMIIGLNKAIQKGDSIKEDDDFIGYYESSIGTVNLVHLRGVTDTENADITLLDLFSRNVGIAFENAELHRDVEDTQNEMIHMLGEVVENRSLETGNHIRRVAEISELLALKAGIAEDEAKLMKLASPMHDIGKIAIPDSILNKPGKLTDEEFTIMKSHAQLGYDILKNSTRRILQAGAIIARDHHEKWNGKGYPNGISGTDIHIYGRIVAIADVYDALRAKRCYKDPWPEEKVLNLFKEEKGEHFDPDLIDIFFNNLDEIRSIMDKYPD